MHVLLVTHQYFPEYRAGTEVLTRAVAHGMRARACRVTIVAGHPDESLRDDSRRFERVEFEGVTVHRFRHSHAAMGRQRSVAELGYRNDLVADWFSKLLHREAPDIVHVLNFARLGIGIVDEAGAAGVPVVFTATDFWAACPTAQLTLPDGRRCPGPDRLAGNCLQHLATQSARTGSAALARLPPVALSMIAALARVFPGRILSVVDEIDALSRRSTFIRTRLAQLDRVFVPTRLMRQAILDLGVQPSHVFLQAYGMQPPPDDLRQEPIDPEAQRLVLGFVGTLAPHKGLHVVLDALERSPTGDFELHVYGLPGDDADYLNDVLARIERLPCARWLGTFPPGDIHRVMASFHALVLPSLWQENAPLVVHAAHQAGRPVIASDLEGLADLVEPGCNGLTFKAGDAEGLGRLLIEIAGDRSILKRISQGIVRPRSTDDYVDELLVHYAQVCQGRSGSR